ncbi:MAG TPA: hypothetical protein VLA74_00245 [Nitrososphaeraceae archaeon]|nr:hypothetical protein [Nitrososphaeraceae archaeon]
MFVSHNIERYDDYGYFQRGDKVTACVENFDENNYRDCDTATVNKFGIADFNLKAAPY